MVKQPNKGNAWDEGGETSGISASRMDKAIPTA